MRIRRVQDRGYHHKHKNVDPDTLPTQEKIIHNKTNQPVITSGNICAASARIERKIDLKSLAIFEVSDFLSTVKAANMRRSEADGVRINDIGRLTVTYYGSHVMNEAFANKFPAYGKDFKQTRNILSGFHEEFVNFMSIAKRAQTEMEEPIYAEQFSHNPETDGSLLKPYNFRELKWGKGVAVIDPAVLVLKGMYMVFDLSGNDYMNEEYADIGKFIRVDQRLPFNGNNYNNGNGKSRYILHGTFAEVSPKVLAKNPPGLPATPMYLPLQEPSMFAKVWPPES